MKNIHLYLLSLLCLSQAPNIVRWAQLPIEVFGFWRLFLATLLLLPFAIYKGRLFESIKKHPKDALIALLSGIFLFTHLWTFFYAAKNTVIANGMIIYSSNPLFVALGAFLFFKHQFSLRILLAYIFAIAGIYHLVSHNMSLNPDYLMGDISALFSAILFAGYILTGKKVRHHFSNSAFASIVYFVSCVLFGLLAFYENLHFVSHTTTGWLAIIASVLFPTFLGHFLFTYLMKHMNVSAMTLGKLVEPTLSSLGAYLFFGEILTKNTVIAFSLVSLSIVILFFPTKKKQS